MDQFTKEGRKLRPRKTTSAQNRPAFEKVEYHRNSENTERRPYGENRGGYESRGNYGERRPYGEGRSNNYGESRGNYGRSGNYGEHRSYGEGRSNYGENRGSYGDRRPRQYGGNYARRPDSGEGRSSYGEHRGGYGESRGNYGRSGYGEHRSYGEGRSSYGENRGNYGDRKPRQYGAGGNRFGGKRPGGPGAGKRPGAKRGFQPAFTKESEEGINRMLSSKPVINGREAESDFQAPINNIVRLNKFIANSGVCSRREADTLIQAGVVTVNGEVVTELGTKINVLEDEVKFNGERLKGEEKVYIILNKPKGYVTTASDPHAEKTVLDLIKGCSSRVYPVGRLDKNTTGVLMLTNDGEIAERLTHPSYDKKKIYQVALDKPLSEEDYNTVLAGVTLSDGEVSADQLEYIDDGDHRKLGIEIHSGKNRVVRRIFETLGYTVKALDRVYFAGLTKKGLKKGEWRYLTEGEANILKMGAYV